MLFKKTHILGLIFILSISFYSCQGQAENPNGLTLDRFELHGVSTNIAELNKNPYGSIVGGTYLYLRVTGHDLTPSNNVIKVGPYPCNIPEKGVNESTITCETTEAWDYNRRWGLTVEISHHEKGMAVCVGKCKFNYSESYTPILYHMTPNTFVPDSYVKFNGVWRISNTKYITQLFSHNEKYGKFNCNQFKLQDQSEGPMELNPDSGISNNGYVEVECQTAADQPAGFYQALAKTTYGDLEHRYASKQITADGSQEYNFVVTGAVESVNQSQGGSLGNILEITGKGFGTDASTVSVDVGGLACTPQKVTSDKLKCELAAGNTSASRISGQGLEYKLYDFNGSTIGSAASFKEKLSSLADDKILKKGTLSNWDYNGMPTKAGVYARGYFKAPSTGTYNFWVAGDDQVQVYLNTNANDVDPANTELVASRDKYSSLKNYFSPHPGYELDSGYRGKDVSLTAGQYYYTEIFCYNGGGASHFTVSVETPIIGGKAQINSVSQLQSLNIEAEHDREIWTLQIIGQKEKEFALGFVYKDTKEKKTYTDKTDKKAWPVWTDKNMASQLNSQSGGYRVSVEKILLNAEKAACPTCTDETAEGVKFIITFNLRRPTEGRRGQPLQVLDSNISKSLSKTGLPSAPLEGTYQLTFNGKDLEVKVGSDWVTEIPYSYNAGKILEGLKKLLNERDIGYYKTESHASEGIKTNFYLKTTNKSWKGLTEGFKLKSNELKGGKPGSSININISNIIPGSDKPLFEPVPFDMSYTAASTSQVVVTVNNIVSVCKNDCSYASNSGINLTQASFTQTNKDIQITMSATTGLDKTIKVWFGAQECTNVSVAGAVISCSTANIPEAGSHAPKVYVQDYGFATQATAKEIDLTFTSASPNSGSVRGGQKVTITGAAFPTSATGLVVKFKDTVAVIESVSETTIVVISPPDSDYDGSVGYANNSISITIEFGGKSKTSSYTYSIAGLATVTSLGSTSASPTLKGTLVINGSGFGTNTALVSVWLLKKSDRSRVYELQIDSSPAMTDSKITATLGGGASGEYIVSVENAQGGSISTGTNADFQYIIPLTGISPSSGSKLGGTLLTLTGDNFSVNKLDNAVFLSKTVEKNLQCKIITASKTQITCLTPVMTPEFTGSLNVVVQGKLIEDSKCSGSCTFSYEDSKTGSITEDQTFKGKKGDTMTVNGTGFGAAGSAVIQFPGDVQVSGTVSSATQLTFDIPSIAAGKHTVVVNPNNQGYAGFITVEVTSNIESITPATISKAGGDIVIAGSGFAPTSTVQIGGTDCPIATQTTDSITCQAQPASGSKTVKVKNNDNDNNESQSSLDFDNSATIGASATTPGSSSSEFAANSNLQIAITTMDTTSKSLTTFLQLDGSKRTRYAGSVAGTTLNFANIPAGSYKLYVVVDGQGYAQLSGTAITTLTVTLTTPTYGSQTTSLAGQSEFTISGSGFDIQNLENNSVHVCGYPCPISSATTFSSLKCTLPTVLTSYLRADAQGLGTVPSVHSFESSKVPFAFIADNLEKAPLVQDNKRSTYYQNSGGDECFIGFDFQTLRMELTTLRYQVKQVTSNPLYYEKFHGTVLQGSNDNSTWTTLHTIGVEVHNGYNTIKLDNQSQYQYIRFFQNSEEGVSCEFAEISIWGHEYYPQSGATAADFSCEVNVEVNGQKHKQANGITYSASNTPKVDSISPTYGWQLGGTVVTVTGTGFSGTQANNKVTIDGIDCVVSASTTTTITCTTGDKGISNKAEPSLQVSVENSGTKYYAIVPDDVIFYYGLLWSNDATWGGDAPPRKGDSVYVPKGQILIVDKSSPKELKAVTVEGIILFADNQDLTFDAHYIIVRGGKFIVGTEKRPYNNKLTITLYGNYFDKQLPEVGNKVLACLQCELNLFGTVKQPVWTTISAQANPNDTTITLTDTPTNWQAGDIIVLATTSYSGTESEELTIKSIAGNVITLDTPLKYKHISQAATYGSKTVEMRAEVGNLSRNVIIQGNPEDSIQSRYGGHVIIHGQAEQGSVAKVSHIQFQYTGQPRIIGRYNLHFHMNGNTSKSFVKGIAVRHSNARMVALHAIHYLTVENNVGYDCMGHNIFLEDGIETHNRIINNLVISPISGSNMLQTDMTVACIWVTNPLNYVTGNHVVGSQFYGMWYEIKEHPDGPSATDEICPRGMKFGTLVNNVGHSNLRFGLRFFILTPRTHPCKDIEYTITEDLNPTIQGVIEEFVSYKNGESGILAEQVGNLVFRNTYLIDNVKSGFTAHDTSFSKEEVIFENSVIAGSTPFNGESDEFLTKEKTRAIQFPRTSGFRVRNVSFYNFPAVTTLLESAALNQFVKVETRGGKQHSIEQSTIDSTASSAKKVAYVGPRMNYIHDKDGTITGNNVESFIAPYYNHFDQAITDGKCTKEDGDKYDNSVLCTGTQIRGFIFEGAEPANLFNSGNLKIQNLQDTNKNVYLSSQKDGDDKPEDFANVPAGSMISKDCAFCYGVSYPTGYAFNMHWNRRQDFSFLKMNDAVLDYRPSDNPTVFRFNFTETRELFDVFAPELKYAISEKSRVIDTNEKPVVSAESCETGDYFVDPDLQLFYLCINGKGKAKYSDIKVDAVYCRETCPIPGFNCEKEVGKVRKFSEPANFLENSGQKMRKSPGEVEYQYGEFQTGDDVVIPCEYTMVLDKAEVEFGTLIIDGTLQIDATKDTHIKAKNIWIRGGKLVAGSVEQPIASKLTITLLGDVTNEQIVIDDFVTPSMKAIVVTGKLDLYGPEQTTYQTRLAANIKTGDQVLKVTDDISTWKVGDQLVLGAANADGTGHEKVTIKTIDTANKSVTIEENIQFFHYGSEKTTIGVEGDNAEVIIDGKYGGGLDMRTVVGHITRNIKIEGSADGNLAGHIKAYHWEAKAEGSDNTVEAFGRINLHGVELSNVGQAGSENAGLNLYFTNSDDEKHSFKSISVHDCPGECVKFVSANNFLFENNVVYNSHGFAFTAFQHKKASIQNNVFVGSAIDNDVPDMKVGLVYIPENYEPSTFLFTNNVGQGSESLCFGLPSIECDQAGKSKVFNNEVGKCGDVGVIFNASSGSCRYGASIGIFHSNHGISTGSKTQTYTIEKVRIIESSIGIKLRTGSGNRIINDNTFKNAYISAQLLQNCPDCYLGAISRCSNAKAIQLHVTTNGASTIDPDSTVGFSGYDVICVEPTVYTSVYLQDIEIHNYKKTYSGLDSCSNNIVFKNHGSADDATAGHYLSRVKCIDCEEKQFAIFDNPNIDHRGWFGGCGNMDCTGKINILVQDMTGDFLGAKGSIISNNEGVGDGLKDSCTYSPEWNGFKCTNGNDLAMLEFEGIGPDKNKLLSSPVKLMTEKVTNTLNQFREWSWNGPEPLNERPNKYVGIIEINQRHNITFAGTKPFDMMFKLQQRKPQGEKNRYIIVEMMYGNSMTIQVVKHDQTGNPHGLKAEQGQIMEPFPFSQPPDLTKHATTCGANNYFYQNRTIHFVVTNEPDCQLQVLLINMVQVNIRLAVTQEEFLYEDNTSNFISKIQAFLDIPTDRLKIVGIKAPARRILQDNTNTDDTNKEENKVADSVVTLLIQKGPAGDPEAGYKAQDDWLQLREEAEKLKQGLIDGIEGIKYEVKEVDYEIHVAKEAGIEDENKDGMFQEHDLVFDNTDKQPVDNKKSKKSSATSKKNLAIILGVTLGLLGVAIVAGVIVYTIYKQRMARERVKVQQQEQNGVESNNQLGILSNNLTINEKQLNTVNQDHNNDKAQKEDQMLKSHDELKEQ